MATNNIVRQKYSSINTGKYVSLNFIISFYLYRKYFILNKYLFLLSASVFSCGTTNDLKCGVLGVFSVFGSISSTINFNNTAPTIYFLLNWAYEALFYLSKYRYLNIFPILFYCIVGVINLTSNIYDDLLIM